MDPGGAVPYSGYPTMLRPRPVAEGGVHGYFPVTQRTGCVALSPCVPAGLTEPLYIDNLVSHYGGTGLPTAYTASDPLYTNSYTGAFTTVPASVCGNISSTIVLNAGNWYANCSINIKNGGALVIRGGNLVIDGGIAVAAAGCLVVNINRTTCATAADVTLDSTGSVPAPDPSTAHTALDQTESAFIYLRGPSGFDDSGNIFMPKTFVYSANPAKQLRVDSTGTTFWTSPGTGHIVANKHTALEIDCITNPAEPDPAKQNVSEDCLNSRFSRLVFYSEYAAPKTKSNTFNGQGNLNVVGVFFTPAAYFNFTGGSSYTAAAAQFWADIINVNGGAILGLIPDDRTAISSPAGAVTLIR
jgi:hypothetical protein